MERPLQCIGMGRVEVHASRDGGLPLDMSVQGKSGGIIKIPGVPYRPIALGLSARLPWRVRQTAVFVHPARSCLCALP